MCFYKNMQLFFLKDDYYIFSMISFQNNFNNHEYLAWSFLHVTAVFCSAADWLQGNHCGLFIPKALKLNWYDRP